VYVAKSNGKLRGLGIPTMRDRAMQALYLQALDPIAETLADPNSYGFRTHRAPADAIEQCFIALAKKASPRRTPVRPKAASAPPSLRIWPWMV
jgi:RNA-directed DNA polymerase